MQGPLKRETKTEGPMLGMRKGHYHTVLDDLHLLRFKVKISMLDFIDPAVTVHNTKAGRSYFFNLLCHLIWLAMREVQ